MSECKIEFDETTGAVTVGLGELPPNAFVDFRKSAIKSIIFTGPVIAPVDCSHLFSYLRNLIQIEGLEYLDTASVTDMSGMFFCCESLQFADVSHFDTSNVENVSEMFKECISLSRIDTSRWDISNVRYLNETFCKCTSLESIDVSGWKCGTVENASRLFNGCTSLEYVTGLSDLDLSSVKDISEMFSHCMVLDNIDVSKWHLSNLEECCGTFSRCEALKQADLRNWDFSKVKAMSNLFFGCSNLSEVILNQSKLIEISKASNMFYGCKRLDSIVGLEQLKLSGDVVARGMFAGCTSLNGLDLSSWDTSQALDTVDMFKDCPAGKMWEPILNYGGLDHSAKLMRDSTSIPRELEKALIRVRRPDLTQPESERTQVEEFKNTTEKFFKPIEADDRKLRASDYENAVIGALEDLALWNNLDLDVIDAAVIGSRSRGLEHDGSDVDVVVEYRGDLKEDYVFGELQEILKPDNFASEIKIDANPIRAEESGTLGQYLTRADDYLKGQMRSQMKSTHDGLESITAAQANKDIIIGTNTLCHSR